VKQKSEIFGEIFVETKIETLGMWRHAGGRAAE
jgi:hypothetical protein